MVEAQQASSSLSTSPTPQDLRLQAALSLLVEGIALKEQEVALAHEMQNLPLEERQEFLVSKLMPVVRQIVAPCIKRICFHLTRARRFGIAG